MRIEVSRGYFALCRNYGWKATWEGLLAFRAGIRAETLKKIAQ